MSKSWLAVGLLALVAAAVAAGVLLVSLALPPALEEPSRVEWFTVGERSFSDEQTVQLVVESGPIRSVLAPRAGVITASSCQAGLVIDSGTAPFGIDGEPIIALATRVPMWRDLANGSKGSDVRALEDELARLGANLEPDDTASETTLRAFADLVADAGGTTMVATTVSLSYLAWVPASSMPVIECPVPIGARVMEGDVLARLPSLVFGVKISPSPVDGSVGGRVAQVDGEGFAIDADGNLLAEDFDRLGATASFAAAAHAGVPINATMMLAEPIDVYVIPPRALVADGGVFCVVDDTGTVAVELLSSQLGQSFIRPVVEDVKLTRVQLDPSEDVTCG